MGCSSSSMRGSLTVKVMEIYTEMRKEEGTYFAATRRQNLLKDLILIRWGWWRARWSGVKSMECFQEYRKTVVT